MEEPMDSTEEKLQHVEEERDALLQELAKIHDERDALQQNLDFLKVVEERNEPAAMEASPVMFSDQLAEELERVMAERAAEMEKRISVFVQGETELREANHKLQKENVTLRTMLEGVGEEESDDLGWTDTSTNQSSIELAQMHVGRVPKIERRIPVGAARSLKRLGPVNSMLQPQLDANGESVALLSGPTTTSINDWSVETESTARKWQKDIAKSSFIYGELLANNDLRMQQVLVTTLLLSVLMTLLSTLSVALGALDFSSLGVSATTLKWAVFTFNIVTACAAAIVMVGNGLMKIFGWDLNVKNLTRFVQRLDSEWFVFETELNIPQAQRQNGTDFIKRADGDYMHLMQQCPPIDGDDYVSANQKYQERLFDNFVWQQKFNQRIDQLRVSPQAPQSPTTPEEMV